MEGKPDPHVTNHVKKTWDLHRRVGAEDLMKDLVAHPAWAVVDELVEESVAYWRAKLGREAHKAALAIDPQQSVEYARLDGVVGGMTFARDVIASLLDSAERAAIELKKTADLDEAAERSWT